MNLAEIRTSVRYAERHDEGHTHWDGCEAVHGWCAARVLLERVDELEALLREARNWPLADWDRRCGIAIGATSAETARAALKETP